MIFIKWKWTPLLGYMHAIHQFTMGRYMLQILTLRCRHNDQDGVSNHQPHGCLLNRLFRGRSNKTSKLRVTGLCVGNSPGPVNSPHKGPVTRKMFPFDDVIMNPWWIGEWLIFPVVLPGDWGQTCEKLRNIIRSSIKSAIAIRWEFPEILLFSKIPWRAR